MAMLSIGFNGQPYAHYPSLFILPTTPQSSDELAGKCSCPYCLVMRVPTPEIKTPTINGGDERAVGRVVNAITAEPLLLCKIHI